jgi:hypothetical protein
MYTYLARLMEEEDFLHEICLTALFSSRAVRFAAVLDASGKLIVGKYRKGIQNASRPSIISDHYYYQSSYLFYLDHLFPHIMKKRKLCLEFAEEQEVHFEITEIADNIKVAVTPLTESKDKYLCIYLESSATYEEIISKLRNAI